MGDKEDHKRWRSNNKEKIKEKNKKYYLLNKEYIQEKQKEYKKKNKEKIRIYSHIYKKDNKEYLNNQQRNRRIKEINRKWIEKDCLTFDRFFFTENPAYTASPELLDKYSSQIYCIEKKRFKRKYQKSSD